MYKMSIVVGDINFQYIEFENLYSTWCINPNLEPYNAQQASEGYSQLIINYFGVGDFKNFHLPQDQHSEYEKCLLIY